jgi:hypothetical protein
VDCAVRRRNDAPDDQTDNALLRQMLQACRRPRWCHAIVVTADAAYASQATRATIQALD